MAGEMSKNSLKLEFSVEQYLTKQAKKREGICIKLPANLYTGIPDRLVLLPGGYLFFAELKRPKGGVLASAQKYWARIIKKLGFKHYVLKNNEEIDEVFKQYERVYHSE